MKVICPYCKTVKEFSSREGWSLMFMEYTKCSKCKGIITLDDVEEVKR